jgi:hypothetical protein
VSPFNRSQFGKFAIGNSTRFVGSNLDASIGFGFRINGSTPRLNILALEVFGGYLKISKHVRALGAVNDPPSSESEWTVPRTNAHAREQPKGGSSLMDFRVAGNYALITHNTSPPGFNLIPYKCKPTAAPISSWTVRSDLIVSWLQHLRGDIVRANINSVTKQSVARRKDGVRDNHKNAFLDQVGLARCG